MGHVCLLSIQRQSFVLFPFGKNIPAFSPWSLHLLPLPLSPVFVSNSLPSVPLGQINLSCAENLILRVLSQNWSFQEGTEFLTSVDSDKTSFPQNKPSWAWFGTRCDF